MARLSTLRAAYMMDEVGNKIARSEIAQIKVSVPSMAVKIIDAAIQIHGGEGVSQDTILASLFQSTRYLELETVRMKYTEERLQEKSWANLELHHKK